MTQAPVVRAVTVQTPADRAFATFTDRIGEWWPLSTHSPGESLSSDLAFEDAKLVESGPAGTAVWGTVTGPVTSIGIDFEESDGQTRVVLTHDGREANGERAPDVREAMTESWPGAGCYSSSLLRRMCRRVRRTAALRSSAFQVVSRRT